MSLEQITGLCFTIIGIYLFVGLLFAIPFVIKGVDRIDEGAHGSTWGFRIIIIPGVMAFWPVLLRKWVTKKRAPKS